MCVFNSAHQIDITISPAIACIFFFFSVTNKCRLSATLRATPFWAVNCKLCKKLSCSTCNNNRRQGNNLCKAWKQLLCSHVIWVKNKQIRPYGALLDCTICLLDDECPLYRVGIGKSILLKLKQYRVVLIRRAKSKWGGFDTSLQDSSLPSNDTLSILALHW